MADYTDTEEFRGARFRHVDLAGATFRECDLRGVRIVASEVADFHVSGFGGEIGTIVVNDVDVTAFVEAQLDGRHPERIQFRDVRTADDHRAMWDRLEHLWSESVARAERLPESLRHEGVNDEWSFVETLRHLVFAIDVWMGRMVRDQPMPYHRFGLPPSDYPAAGAADIGIDLEAQPSFAEVVAMHADRQSQVSECVSVGDRRRAHPDAHRRAGAGVGCRVVLRRPVPARGDARTHRAPPLRPARSRCP